MKYNRSNFWGTSVTEHTVVLIEYFGGIPHEVQTISDRSGTDTWNIDPYGGDLSDLMLYHSGSGFSLSIDIEAASPDSRCEVWINPDFKDRVVINKLVNANLIDRPYEHTDGFICSINPFEYCREVGDITYCNACEKHYNEDYCPAHDCEFTEGAEEEWKSRNE